MVDYSLSGKLSYWLDTSPDTSYSALEGDIEVDVAIIGGGIAGLHAGFMLAEAGVDVAIIERHKIASGVTGYTTAKLTSQHGLIYKDLISKFGEEQARYYAEANEAAIKYVIDFAEKKGIDCDIRRMPSYTYTLDEAERKTLHEEADAAKRLGLPAEYSEEVPLPFATAGAVRFDNQGVYHPRKYLLTIAKSFHELGGKIYEHTVAQKIDEEDTGCIVNCNSGNVRAKQVIIATNYPIKDPRLLFARLTTRQSYVLGVRLAEPFPKAHFYSSEENFHSLRPHLWGTEHEILLVGGEYHVTGHENDTQARYKRLEEWTRKNFAVKSIDYAWTTHDAESFDRVPMIGKLTSGDTRLYVATGFKGWGMTHGVVAGMILSDEIRGRKNPWSALYNPNRIKSFLSTEMLSFDVSSVATLISGKLKGFAKGTACLAEDEACLAEIDNHKVALYKDVNGKIHAISAACTHMGCIINWNNAEKTWDCPCHGSRFDIDGNVVHAPAVENLGAVDADK